MVGDTQLLHCSVFPFLHIFFSHLLAVCYHLLLRLRKVFCFQSVTVNIESPPAPLHPPTSSPQSFLSRHFYLIFVTCIHTNQGSEAPGDHIRVYIWTYFIYYYNIYYHISYYNIIDKAGAAPATQSSTAAVLLNSAGRPGLSPGPGAGKSPPAPSAGALMTKALAGFGAGGGAASKKGVAASPALPAPTSDTASDQPTPAPSKGSWGFPWDRTYSQ